MEIKDILLVLEADRSNEAAIETACRLSRDNRASIHARCVVPWKPSPAECFAVGRAADLDVLDHAERKVAAAMSAVKTALCAALTEDRDLGDCERVDQAEAPFVIPSIAQSCDIVVMGHELADGPQGRELADAILLKGGTPCLFVPSGRAAADFSTIVLAWNGTAEGKRAIDASLPLLKRAKQVCVVVVDDPTTIDQSNDERMVVRRLERHGIHCTTRRESGHGGHAADALIALCEELAADLLVMGAFGHSHLVESVFGGTSHTALASTGLPLLMVK